MNFDCNIFCDFFNFFSVTLTYMFYLRIYIVFSKRKYIEFEMFYANPSSFHILVIQVFNIW